jgi:hypothetical protein
MRFSDWNVLVFSRRVHVVMYDAERKRERAYLSSMDRRFSYCSSCSVSPTGSVGMRRSDGGSLCGKKPSSRGSKGPGRSVLTGGDGVQEEELREERSE